jgi:hypothetical protein
LGKLRGTGKNQGKQEEQKGLGTTIKKNQRGSERIKKNQKN